MSLRIALFASGTGSNALNLLKTARDLPNLKIPLLIVDQETSPLPAKVRELYPETEVQLIVAPKAADSIETDSKKRKQIHEEAILKALHSHQIDWIFLAGYMRMVGETLLTAYSSNGKSRIVNIHPSLLPAYPGLHSYERAFQANEQKSGVTLHLVDAGMDTGPVLIQQSFAREPDDTLARFKERGLALEWKLYSQILKQLHDTKTLQAQTSGER